MPGKKRLPADERASETYIIKKTGKPAMYTITYAFGNDLFDESFSIETEDGEFLGECGFAITETLAAAGTAVTTLTPRKGHVGKPQTEPGPRKVTVLEVWLFDKNDIQTATRFLVSRHADKDPGTRERNGQRGELIIARPRAKVVLETATLQVQATVVERKYGVDRTAPKDSYFETVTLNIKCLQREL